MENKDFTREFHRMWDLIDSKKPMAYARYADGEVCLMKGLPVGDSSQAKRIDKWEAPEKMTLLGQDLLKTLEHTEPEYYYAISCECCDPNGKQYLLENIQQNLNNITYSNLWINGNYTFFKDKINNITESIVVIANKEGKDNMFPFWIEDYFPIENECVKFYEENKYYLLNSLTTRYLHYMNTLFFISAGPLSEIIIDHLWRINPTNRYIDVGSALDESIHQHHTREFMSFGSHYSQVKCKF